MWNCFALFAPFFGLWSDWPWLWGVRTKAKLFFSIRFNSLEVRTNKQNQKTPWISHHSIKYEIHAGWFCLSMLDSFVVVAVLIFRTKWGEKKNWSNWAKLWDYGLWRPLKMSAEITKFISRCVYLSWMKMNGFSAKHFIRLRYSFFLFFFCFGIVWFLLNGLNQHD